MITSLFASMNHAVRAMQNAQHALNVHGTNIAHANDPNYTRRDVINPSEAGVNGPGILRFRDQFVDAQYRSAAGGLGESEVRKSMLSKVEDIFGDPVEGGLRKAIDQLFDGWQGLAENPADGVARLQVLSAGRNFSQQIKSTYQQLSDVEQTINEELAVRVGEVNTQLTRVYDLNRQVAEMQRNGVGDAELRDERDATLDKLAKLMGGSAQLQPDGSFRVVVGTTVIVDGARVMEMSLQASPGGPVPVWKGPPDIPFNGQGAIAGLVSVRDQEIKSLKADIDGLGKTVANELNVQHRLGKGLDGIGGRDLFSVTAAPADIIINESLFPDQLAAGGPGGTGAPSDGENARAITGLGEKAMLESVIIPGQMQSPRVYYRNLVGWVGTRAKDSQDLTQVTQTQVRMGEQQRQSQSGVSLDEETAHLQMQQRAFAAAARVITTMDEMLDTLINRTGHW